MGAGLTTDGRTRLFDAHAVAILMHIDLSAQGSLTVQSVVFQMFTRHKSVVDLQSLGGIMFQSILMLICL